MALQKATSPRSDMFAFLDSSSPWKGYSMLVFGAPGSGKTYLAGTSVQVPEMREVLLVDNDGGSRTVRDKPHFEGIKILRIFGGSGSKAYSSLVNWLNHAKMPTEDKTSFDAELGEPENYKTIIVDNLGALHESLILEILDTVSRNRPHEETPSQSDYGLARSRMRNIFRALSKYSEQHGVTFIFTCHVDIMRSEYETIAKMRPAIPGKLAYEIPGDLPIVGYLEVETTKKTIGQSQKTNPKEGGSRIIYFDPRVNAKLEIKDQSEKLGATVVDPTMLKVYQALYG